VIWLILGIFICIHAVQLKLGSLRAPSTGFLPFLCGLCLLILGLILVIPNVSKRLREKSRATDGRGPRDWKKFLNPSLTIAMLLGYVLLLDTLGFVLVTFLCLLILFKLSAPEKWLQPFVLSFATAAISYLLFSVWLQCQFPKGLLGSIGF
jgi:hypothetical protein